MKLRTILSLYPKPKRKTRQHGGWGRISCKSIGLIALWWTLAWSVCSAQINESNRLNKIVPMAPESAKFASYYFTPPVSATGTIPIEIPLYDIHVDGVHIPITLSYLTSGIKVTDLSGSVGLGWSLNVGGGIYRSINGKPDEYVDANTSTFLGPLYSMSDYIAGVVDNTTVQNQSFLEAFANNVYDTNQDNYSYNFLNYSGGIFFNDQLELKELNDNRLFFSYDSKYLNHFIANDGQGNVFKFDIKETTHNSSYSTNVTTTFNGSVYGATAWKLSEITTVHNKKINFSYVDYTTSILYPSANTLYHIQGLNYEPTGDCFDDKTVFSTSYSNINSTSKLISSVSSEGLTITFSYSDEPNASNWKKKLDKIEIRNKKDELVKRIRFDYELFNGDPRLKLSRLAVEEIGGQEQSIYSFLYHEEMGLPDINSMGKDIFGFYNGHDNNTTLLKTAIPSNIIAESLWNSKREVNEYNTKIGSLRQIIYPTAGGLKIYYSANQQGVTYAPGIKVDKLELFDSNGDVVNTKLYEYEQIEGLRINFPDYAIRETPVSGSLFGSQNCFSYYSENTMQQKHLPGNFFYKKVTIREISQGKESSTVEYYNDPIPNATNEPLDEYIYQPVLVQKEYFAGSPIDGAKVKSESFSYQPIVSQTDAANMYELVPPYLDNIYLSQNGNQNIWPCFNFRPGVVVKNTRRPKWLRLNNRVETQFFDDGQSAVVSSTYYYDNLEHKYPTRIRTANSRGDTINQSIKYPQDMVLSSNDPSGVYAYMSSKNIINKPVISMEEIGERIKGETNGYSMSSHGFPVLNSIKSYNDLSEQFEERVTYNIYDSDGNPLETRELNGPTTVYLWGYGGQYPVAKIENATYQEVSDILGTSVIHTLNSPLVSDETINTAINTLRNHTDMKNTMVSTYTYKPLVGMASMTDPRGVTEYYRYDGFQRLKDVLDFDENILRNYQYHYMGTQTSPVVYSNAVKSQTFTRNNCPSGQQGGSVTYTVAAGTHTSTVSQTAADQLAQDDINANGQAYANQHGGCTVVSNCTQYRVKIPSHVLQNNNGDLFISYPTCGGGHSGVISIHNLPAELDESCMDCHVLRVCADGNPSAINFYQEQHGGAVFIADIQIEDMGPCN